MTPSHHHDRDHVRRLACPRSTRQSSIPSASSCRSPWLPVKGDAAVTCILGDTGAGKSHPHQDPRPVPPPTPAALLDGQSGQFRVHQAPTRARPVVYRTQGHQPLMPRLRNFFRPRRRKAEARSSCATQTLREIFKPSSPDWAATSATHTNRFGTLQKKKHSGGNASPRPPPSAVYGGAPGSHPRRTHRLARRAHSGSLLRIASSPGKRPRPFFLHHPLPGPRLARRRLLTLLSRAEASWPHERANHREHLIHEMAGGQYLSTDSRNHSA